MRKLTVLFAVFILIAGLGMGTIFVRYPQLLKPGAQEEVSTLSYQPHPDGDVIANGVSQNPQEAIQQMIAASHQDPNILSLYLSEFGGTQVFAADFIDDTARAQATDQLEEILTNSTVNLVPIEEETITYIAMDESGNPYETTVDVSSLENPTQLVFTTTAEVSAMTIGNFIAIINDCGNPVYVGCNEGCDYPRGTRRCSSGLVCYQDGNSAYCRNRNCQDEESCVCPTPTVTPTPTPIPPTVTPVPTVTLTPTPTMTPTPTVCPLPEQVEGVEVICP